MNGCRAINEVPKHLQSDFKEKHIFQQNNLRKVTTAIAASAYSGHYST
jgi:hypothetical protein